MHQRKRLLIEIVVAVLLLLLAWTTWSLTRRSGERQRAELVARQESTLEATRQQAELRAARMAEGEARAVFRAFAAGIQASAVGQQKGMLNMAKTNLLQLPYVAFVHVLTPDGQILTTSNGKYEVAGRVDGRADWALAATELVTRPGDLPGTLEIAAPFQGASGRAAVLWMGYKTHELVSGGRPGAAAQ